MMVHMDFLTFAVLALATARISRLVTADRIFDAPRNAVIRRLDPDGLAAYWLVCTWCASVTVGAAVAGSWALWGSHQWFTLITCALAFSHIAGFLASKEG